MPDAESSSSYRFAGFELRPRERMLLADGAPLAVGPRAFDVLVALVERAGKLATKDELLDRVWPKLVVEENNLQVQVSALRKVVGQQAIATVPGHGYRFIPAVEVVAGDPPLPVRPQPPGLPEELRLGLPPGLPRQATSFVGRAEEVRECVRLLGQSPLLTLVGVGGIGKTRLSLEVAAASEGFTDGAAFVDLAPVTDAASMVDVATSALGVTARPGQTLKEALQQQVASRRPLVVIDHCEHLLAASAELEAELLQSSPGSKVIATSREPLRTAGEVIYRVPGLGVADTGRLFVERAQAFDSQFAVTAQNAAAIGQIGRDLDGIPLALELAAARLRVMPVEAVARHLSERFQLLAGGDGATLSPQRTLQAALDWSYELLTPGERALLRRLSVFAGGFELDAAEAVGRGDDMPAEDVLYLLGDLVDTSLVAFDPWSSRYRLLEPVRQYAQERLDDADVAHDARNRVQSLPATASLVDECGRDALTPAAARQPR